MGQIASELGLEFGLGLGLESKSKEPVENKQEETFQPLREMTDKIKKDATAPRKTGALL